MHWAGFPWAGPADPTRSPNWSRSWRRTGRLPSSAASSSLTAERSRRSESRWRRGKAYRMSKRCPRVDPDPLHDKYHAGRTPGEDVPTGLGQGVVGTSRARAAETLRLDPGDVRKPALVRAHGALDRTGSPND